MPDNIKIVSNASIDILTASKDLLDNNQYAIDAIHNRNIQIKNLKSILEHQQIAFSEIEKRYDDLSQKKKEAETSLKELEMEYAQLYDLYSNNFDELKLTKENFSKTLNELIIEKMINEKTFTRKMEKYASAVGGKKGALLKLLFTPPMSKIFLISIILIIFLASIIGWPTIFVAIKWIPKIFFFL